ncbi:hypothetical protein PVAP13_8NG268503 [Panicum virgatum]|uniref:Uncharacterized protein n=1 Tax=Panicum virgatum TaxID=38727 RepID=A0A8T0PCU5_PANVG|nr:hypothetical protein PVAP13_8NG268503 [Panicum virgatum]
MTWQRFCDVAASLATLSPHVSLSPPCFSSAGERPGLLPAAVPAPVPARRGRARHSRPWPQGARRRIGRGRGRGAAPLPCFASAGEHPSRASLRAREAEERWGEGGRDGGGAGGQADGTAERPPRSSLPLPAARRGGQVDGAARFTAGAGGQLAQASCRHGGPPERRELELGSRRRSSARARSVRRGRGGATRALLPAPSLRARWRSGGARAGPLPIPPPIRSSPWRRRPAADSKLAVEEEARRRFEARRGGGPPPIRSSPGSSPARGPQRRGGAPPPAPCSAVRARR